MRFHLVSSIVVLTVASFLGGCAADANDPPAQPNDVTFTAPLTPVGDRIGDGVEHRLEASPDKQRDDLNAREHLAAGDSARGYPEERRGIGAGDAIPSAALRFAPQHEPETFAPTQIDESGGN
jgi:hypothetical protein